jgi:hypothetical protein
MKKKEFTYRIIGLMLTLLMSVTSLSAAQYHGDQPSSPFVRFLRSLFFGESSKGQTGVSSSGGQTYRFSSLSQGSSSTGASSASQNDVVADQSNIWGTTSIITGTHTSQAGSAVNSNYSSTASSSAQIGVGSSSKVSSNSQSSDATTASSTGGVGSSDMIAFSLSSPFSSSALSQRQNAPASSNDFDPPGDPVVDLPVGDGTWTLLLLAVVYSFSIRKRLLRSFEV